jgi:hypothetical protein
MSGGGGSGGSGGGFGRDSGIDCAAIRFDAFLSSVDEAQLGKVHVGDELAVELRQEPRALLVIFTDGAPLGALTRNVRELLRCIQQQVKFKATVRNINGSEIEVRVEAV